MEELSGYKLLLGINDSTKNAKKPVNKKISKEEEIKKFRLKNKIKCHSEFCEIPYPITNFEQLISRFKMSKDFLKCFSSMDYKLPTPVQMQSIPVMMENHSLFTVAPTGSGKTSAFLVPIIHQIIVMNNEFLSKNDKDDVCTPIAVILTPTIELAKQIFQECICLLKELTSQNKPKVSVLYKKKSLNLKAQIIICTPLRLKETLLKNENNYLNLENLRWLVIDESDKMLENSINSFSNQFKVIYEKCHVAESFRIAMFSATQTESVMNWVKENLKEDLVFVRIGVKGAAVETVTQELRYCHSEEIKFYELKNLINYRGLQVPCLIFMDQSDNAVILHEFIKDFGIKANINVEVISGKMADSNRQKLISDFREGKIHFLICTNLLARGIDFKGVSTVINYDLPKHKEEYIHRIGRCGRAGQTGKAISLWTDIDAVNGLGSVLSVMKASNQPVNEELYELVKQRQKRQKKRINKSDKILRGLKRKYMSEDGSIKKMTTDDKRRKMFAENVVVRNKFLKRKYQNLDDNKD